MSTPGPRTMREALAAIALEELDQLTTRVEALPAVVGEAERKIAAAAGALNDAGDRYQAVITSFNDQAREELAGYLQRKAAQVADQTTSEIRSVLIDAAQQAFKTEAADKAAQLGAVLSSTLREFRAAARTRYIEHAFTAIVSAVATAGLLTWLR